MGYDIYINYLASMEAHIGILNRDSHDGPLKDMDFGRPSTPKNTQLLACVSVFTGQAGFPDARLIERVIDEGFTIIGALEMRRLYTISTTDGRFQLMSRPGFPRDARGAKLALEEVVTRLKAPGTGSGPYCGKPDVLVRYGKQRHLEEGLKLGKFRITPATFYNDLSDDSARGDDELCRTFEREPGSLIITTLDGAVLRPKGPVKFTSKLADDYYVLCLSMERSQEIANEFSGSDACLVIKNPNEFAERLHARIARDLPDYIGLDAQVSYGEKSVFGVCFTKGLGYKIQSEFRFAWMKQPHVPSAKLSPFFVEIGSIEDIAELTPLPPRNGESPSL